MSQIRHIKIANHINFTVIDDECVLMRPDGVFYGLDEIGTFIWKLIEAHGNLEVVIQNALAEYEVKEEKLRPDISSLIESLHKAGLVTIK